MNILKLQEVVIHLWLRVREASSSHEIVVEDSSRARNPRCGYVVYLHHNVAAKVAVNRPTAVMRSRLAHTAAADGKVNDCNNCSLPFPFRTKAPLRGGACISPRSTCERARRELGNPVNSLCTIRVQSRSARDRAMGIVLEERI